MSDWDWYTRRRVLSIGGVGVAAAVAGCSESGTDDDGGDGEDDSVAADEDGIEGDDDPVTADEDGIEDKEDEETLVRDPDEMPPAYRIDFRNTGETDHNLFNYTAPNENEEEYDISDPAVQQLNLDELDRWYENNWENTRTATWREFVEGISNSNSLTTAKQNPRLLPYELDDDYPGQFNLERLENAESYQEFRQEFTPLLFNWIASNDELVGPISSHAEDYVPVLQESHQRYNGGEGEEPNFDIHTWHFQAEPMRNPNGKDGGRHGLGQVYDKTNDEMYVFETVVSPSSSQEPPAPLIEESNYLDPDADVFNRQWHPLRFKDIYEDQEQALGTIVGGFENAKSAATKFISYIASASDSQAIQEIETGANFTTGILQEATNAVWEYNNNQHDFQELYDLAKLGQWVKRQEEEFVIAGSIEEPEVYRVEDQEIIDELRNDQNGLYDDFSSVVEEYNSSNYNDWRSAAETANG